VIRWAKNEQNDAVAGTPQGGSFSFRVVQSWGDAHRHRSISSMECIVSNKLTDKGQPADGNVLVTRKNGMVEVINVVDTGDCAWSVDLSSGNSEREVPCSAHHVAINELDHVSVLTESGKGLLYSLAGDDPVAEWKCPPHVTCSTYHGSSHRLAVGCEGAELKVYTIEETGVSQLYAAKGGKPNHVGLCDKPWNSTLSFNPHKEDGSQIIVGTGYCKLRLYDINVGKRPQLDIPFKGFRITAIAPEKSSGGRWWVGDAGGNLQVYDVRAGKFSGAIKGIGGSARSLDIHPSEPLIASAGLDRFMRVNSTLSRSSVAKVYMKSQLTCIRFINSATGNPKVDHDQIKKRSAGDGEVEKKRVKKR
jgi:ribosome biogenesis protein NSA1